MKRLVTLASLRRFGPALFMALLVPALSLLPARFFRPVAKPFPPIPAFDKIVHALMYAALTAACLHAVSSPRRQRLKTALQVALAAVFYGIAMELGQKALTTSRAMDPLDALANAVGAFASALLCFAVMCRRTHLSAD